MDTVRARWVAAQYVNQPAARCGHSAVAVLSETWGEEFLVGWDPGCRALVGRLRRGACVTWQQLVALHTSGPPSDLALGHTRSRRPECNT